MTPFYKGKGDALPCDIQRGERLLEDGVQIFKIVLEEKLKKLVNGYCQQSGFHVRRCMTNCFINDVADFLKIYQQKKRCLFHALFS